MARAENDRKTTQRGLDLLCSAVGLGLYSPFWLLASCAILYEDGPPLLYLQRRAGHKRLPFTVVKLRTMRNGQATRVGLWLRATGLDETLQLVNVLLGQMCMVGPRPLTYSDIDRLGWSTADHDDRWSVPPGITGLAQLFPMGPERSLELDRLYLCRRCLVLDSALMALSFVANLCGKRHARALVEQLPTWKRLMATGR